MKIFKKNRRYIVFLVSLLLIVCLFGYFGPEEIYTQLKEFPLLLNVGVFLMIMANVLVVIYRYWRILSCVGFRLPWSLVFRASTAANIASLLIVPLFGQVAGRQAVLQKAGVSAVENAVIAAYERVLVGGISAVLAFIGGGYLLGNIVRDYAALIPFSEILPIILIAIFFTLFFSISRFELSLYQALLSLKNLVRFIELILITLFSSLLMLSSFSALFHFIAPNADWLSIFSAAAVVSFVAGLPVSFGGWGLREASSIYILGHLGVSSDKALAASILCGILSIGAIIFVAPFALIGSRVVAGSNVRSESINSYRTTDSNINIESAAAWILCFSVSLLILFQVHVTVGSSTINVNLADPFAVLALSVVLLNSFFKRRLPLWYVPHFNALLLLMSSILAVAFFHGWLKFSSSSWAVSKIFGWLVLLGFLASGYLATSYHGARGNRRIIEVMITVLCVVLFVQIIFRVLHVVNIIEFEGFTYSLEGYSGNRNALAFQILAVFAAFIGLLPIYKNKNLKFFPRINCESLLIPVLGLMIIGLYYTSSRSGIAVMFLLLVFSWLTGMVDLKIILKALTFSVSIWLIILYFPSLVGSGSVALPIQVQSEFSGASSDLVRWSLIKQSIVAWLDAPFFGQGLGYFFMKSPELIGFPVIVHNTIFWLLAETGIVGAIGFLLTLFLIVKYLAGDKLNKLRSNSAILLIFCFVLMSLFHEVLYQRIFWFILGSLISVRYSAYAQIRKES
ncbi:lysylphosphatidylglycerol synthase domain-containing protein [Pseudomonas agarici]|uniref:lysylphosphatidylglycerol synthase domain-containing protein n=1 Tax=Pseudomonas agarici TaxID=46677 RepID=UPI00159F7762|nr:lysylphosphatidylglycerol synthase domain-containing protein [Pseudomonas agarici]NWB91695.1 flippase-like domain-containing protein [Pseudomonas agarici]